MPSSVKYVLELLSSCKPRKDKPEEMEDEVPETEANKQTDNGQTVDKHTDEKQIADKQKAVRANLSARDAKRRTEREEVIAEENKYFASVAKLISQQQQRIQKMWTIRMEADYMRDEMILMMTHPPCPEPSREMKERYRDIVLMNRSAYTEASYWEMELEKMLCTSITLLERRLTTPYGDIETARTERDRCKRWMWEFKIQYGEFKDNASDRLRRKYFYCDEKYDLVNLNVNGVETLYSFM